MNRGARPSVRRLVTESMAGVTQRSSRSGLTIVGIALGIASFVAVLGVTSSANGQITRDFDEAAARQVNVQPSSATPAKEGGLFPVGAERAASEILGVEAVGTWWEAPVSALSRLPVGLGEQVESLRVIAASPGYWDVSGAVVGYGRTFDEALVAQPVAVVGEQVAERLGIHPLDGPTTIFLDGHAVSVIGLVIQSGGLSAPLSSVVIPSEYARATFGEPGTSETMTIETAIGASEVVTAQLALAIDPRHPEQYRVLGPPPPTVLRDQVAGSVQSLFLALALICLLVGAVGITNASLIGVVARVPEIGLRRALGALPRDIALQFLIEAGIRGLLGGSLGASLGLCVIAVVALSQQWTAVVQPWTAVLAPLVGATIGLAAGLYPAVRASRIEPLDAFRRL